MRLRKVKDALIKLQASRYFINDPASLKGNWRSVFNNENPIHIEIGCGKGKFISELASINPNINYIAIEKFDSVLLRTAEKLEEMELNNLKIVLIDADKLTDYFNEKEIDLIYINFSDPWPKFGHRKRRLTYKTFLDSYKFILKDDGAVYQKTDNRKLFEFSLESLNNYGLVLSNISLDLHNSDYPDNIMTEYEKRFTDLGQPIYRLEAKKK